MAPTGDPSTFTFTFDAFPSADEAEDKLLYSLAIGEAGEEALEDITQNGDNPGVETKVIIGDKILKATTVKDTYALSVATTSGAVTFDGTAVEMPADWTTGALLTNLDTYVTFGTANTFNITKGKTVKFYII